MKGISRFARGDFGGRSWGSRGGSWGRDSVGIECIAGRLCREFRGDCGWRACLGFEQGDRTGVRCRDFLGAISTRQIYCEQRSLTRQTIQPSSLRSAHLCNASATPSPQFSFPPSPTTAFFRLASASGSRAALFASTASASRTSASAASAALSGGGEARWFRCAVKAEGVRSDWDQRGFRARLTMEVANQSCLKLFSPSAFSRPAREDACSIFARTCGVRLDKATRTHPCIVRDESDHHPLMFGLLFRIKAVGNARRCLW